MKRSLVVMDGSARCPCICEISRFVATAQGIALTTAWLIWSRMSEIDGWLGSSDFSSDEGIFCAPQNSAQFACHHADSVRITTTGHYAIWYLLKDSSSETCQVEYVFELRSQFSRSPIVRWNDTLYTITPDFAGSKWFRNSQKNSHAFSGWIGMGEQIRGNVQNSETKEPFPLLTSFWHFFWVDLCGRSRFG